MKFSEESISALRERISADPEISPKRKAHILAVERMAARLGSLYMPEKTDILRVAALLHDVTKEYPSVRQIEICRRYGHEPTREELCAPKTFHARTAAYLIPDLYPGYADPEVISAVRWHTTGHAGMTLSEMLIYLADYIDDTRTFDDCVKLRRAFFDACPEKMSAEERTEHLLNIVIMSYRMTVSGLISDGLPISPDTVFSMNELLCRKIEKGEKENGK